MKMLIVLYLLLNEFAFAAEKSTNFSFDQLIDKSKTIVLARVTNNRLSEESIISTFAVLETLTGKSEKQFELTMDLISPSAIRQSDLMTDFNKHQNISFWMKYHQKFRSVILTNGKLGTVFNVGYTYLIFLDNLKDVKSYEMIIDNNDLWLQLVKNTIDSEQYDKLKITFKEFIQYTKKAYIGRCPMSVKDSRFSVKKSLKEYIIEISQKPNFHRQVKCRGYGLLYFGFKLEEAGETFAAPLINGIPDFQAYDFQFDILENYRIYGKQ